MGVFFSCVFFLFLNKNSGSWENKKKALFFLKFVVLESVFVSEIQNIFYCLFLIYLDDPKYWDRRF